MKTPSSTVLAVLFLTCLTKAHMQMSDPPPLLSKFNKYTTNQDYDMTSPLHADGSNYPCKGHHQVIGTSQGQPVAQWTPGHSYSMTIRGNTAHNGGSCQASLSFDSGNSWKVLHSYIGNCPAMGDSKFEFTLPGDTPSGQMLFAWTWFNEVGNREMYMNCAVIDIQGGGGRKKRGAASLMTSRPDMFVANVANGCGTAEGKDVMFPDPGPDVDVNSRNTAPPVGKCGASAKFPVMQPGSAPVPSNSASKSPSSPLSDPSSPKLPPYMDVSQPLAPKAPNRVTNSSMTWYSMSHPPTTSPIPANPSPVNSIQPSPSGSCMPGSFQCTASPSGGQGWQACNASGSWVHAGDCGASQVCKFNSANGSPYCVPPNFQFLRGLVSDAMG
ncbi:hypothetical protein C2857_003742 [Epichloe festucae Fl1]|uniref:Extracellular protein n=1 Tax=Epichloe festucae (strain Fl1) TaxID=877507 RepID=A0A7S9KUU0_EPIFF|nr:hypothetical protein C2857_003742 [Epichloe festucae Fl1]